jgi:hypothetical protein
MQPSIDISGEKNPLLSQQIYNNNTGHAIQQAQYHSFNQRNSKHLQGRYWDPVNRTIMIANKNNEKNITSSDSPSHWNPSDGLHLKSSSEFWTDPQSQLTNASNSSINNHQRNQQINTNNQYVNSSNNVSTSTVCFVFPFLLFC